MDTGFRNMLNKVLTSFIGRVVLALFSLVVLPVLPAVVNFVNEVLGYNLTDAQVKDYAETAALGIAGLASIWLLNNGLFERAALKAKELVEAGKEFREDSGAVLPEVHDQDKDAPPEEGSVVEHDPVTPPGLQEESRQ